MLRGMSDDLTHLAVPGATLAVRVMARARRNAVSLDDDGLRVHTTTAPEGGKANEAVIGLLSRALGVPRSQLTLLRGATSRDKLFRVDQPRSMR